LRAHGQYAASSLEEWLDVKVGQSGKRVTVSVMARR
jgi:hypothetical protein